MKPAIICAVLLVAVLASLHGQEAPEAKYYAHVSVSGDCPNKDLPTTKALFDKYVSRLAGRGLRHKPMLWQTRANRSDGTRTTFVASFLVTEPVELTTLQSLLPDLLWLLEEASASERIAGLSVYEKLPEYFK